MNTIRIYKTPGVLLAFYQGQYYSFMTDWNSFVNRKGLFNCILADLKDKKPMDRPSAEKIIENGIQAPIATQEVWAAGVTYYRSRTARMEESEISGGATFYDKVYVAERPEIFFKATPNRVSGHRQVLFIRGDSSWDVPEPELTLFVSSHGTIEGYTLPTT